MALVICLGVAAHDLVMSIDGFPSEPGKYRARDRKEVGGGMAASAAAAISRLGGQAALWSRVGDDWVGERIVADLAELGVDVSAVKRFQGQRSPLSTVFVDQAGERWIINHSERTLADDMDWLPLHRIDEAAAVLVDTSWPKAAVALLAAARAQGKPGVVDADRRPEDHRLIEAASHVAFARDSLELYTGLSEPSEGLRAVRARTEAWLAVTDGAAGVYWLDGETTQHLPAFPVEAVDTTGAGDVFHGALALALSEGQGAEEAVRFSSAAAALKCTHFGGRLGLPNRDELETFLGEHRSWS